LTAAYLTSWEEFSKVAEELLNAARKNPNEPYEPGKRCDKTAYGNTSEYVELVWVSGDAFGEKALFSALIHAPALPAYATTLPGVLSIRQVFVAQSPTHELATLYTSTQQKNPLLDQIPAVAEAAITPFLALASQARGTIDARVRATGGQQPGKGDVWATVATVTFPFERAVIDFKGVAITEPSADAIEKQASALAERLKANDARYSKCGRALADAILKEAKLKSALCSANTASSAKRSCIAEMDGPLATAYETERSKCTTGTPPPSVPESDLEALQQVDGEFRKFFTDLKPKEITAQVKLKNLPMEHYSFGVVSALVVWGGVNKTRVKINDDGNLVSDPLPRQLNMVVLNRSFKAFDSESLTITKEERTRWFVGAVVTPNFGIGGGVSVLAVRGLALNVGAAAIGVPALKKGDTLGQAPTSANDQFGLGIAGSLFVGASYNFK
jgi:hypothetical protein